MSIKYIFLATKKKAGKSIKISINHQEIQMEKVSVPSFAGSLYFAETDIKMEDPIITVQTDMYEYQRWINPATSEGYNYVLELCPSCKELFKEIKEYTTYSIYITSGVAITVLVDGEKIDISPCFTDLK